MRIVVGFALIAATVCLGGHPALAQEPPRLTGAYAFAATTACQAVVTVSKDTEGKVTAVSVQPKGEISESIGRATFTAEGRVTLVGRNVVGSAVFVPGSGGSNAMRDLEMSFDWPVSNTATTLTLNDEVHHAQYSIVKNGVAHHVDFLLREDKRCVRRGTLTRVTP